MFLQLTYADTFNPKLVIDVATLTGAMAVAIGGSAAGVYSTSDIFWNTMQDASFSTGDRVWRMPLWNYYSELMRSMQCVKPSRVYFEDPPPLFCI